MPRQPGSAGAQTIMVPLDLPAVDGADVARRPVFRPAEWQQETQRWRDVEIRRLEALLTEDSTGRSGHGGDGSGGGGGGASDVVGPWLRALSDAPDKGAILGRFLDAVLENDDLSDALVEVEGANKFSLLVDVARQKKGAKALHAVVNNPTSTQEELRAVVRAEAWVFGGRYIPQIGLARIPALAGIDLAMIRSDGAIHVVDLGPARVEQLVVPAEDGGGYRVGPAVLDLVNKAVNDLLIVETQAKTILDELGVETRRAYATVVIGHPNYVPALPRDHVRTTIRTYSSHLAGLEIMTYQELMDSVDRTLALAESGDFDPRSVHGG